MSRRRKYSNLGRAGTIRTLVAALVMLVVPSKLHAQAVHIAPGAKPLLNLNLLTVSATPAAVNFTLVPNSVVTSPTTVTISTSWLLIAAGTVKVYGYFASSTAALSSVHVPGTNIPSSSVLGAIAPGGFNKFTQTGPFGAAGASLLFFSQAAVLNVLGSRTDTLSLQIDLRPQPQLPADTYSGTLVIQAQAL